VLRHVAGSYSRGLERLTYWRDLRGRSEIDIVVWGEGRPVVYTLSPDSIKPFGFGDPIVDFCRNEKVARAYLVSPRTGRSPSRASRAWTPRSSASRRTC
jgi:hypothetical protein